MDHILTTGEVTLKTLPATANKKTDGSGTGIAIAQNEMSDQVSLALTHDLRSLVGLYMNIHHIFDETRHTAIIDRLKQKLAQVAEPGNKISESDLRRLIEMEDSAINGDGCVTAALFSVCRDWDTTMSLWKHFSPGAEVNPRSNDFLRKHLELTCGEDLEKVDAVCKKIAYGRRRSFIYVYGNEIKRKKLLLEVEKCGGDYTALVALRRVDGGGVIEKDIEKEVEHLLPGMIAECGGNIENLSALREKQFCGGKIVEDAISGAIAPMVEECGGDVGKLLELYIKIPNNCRKQVVSAIKEACKRDTLGIGKIFRSNVAGDFNRLIVLNFDQITGEGVDAEDFGRLVNLGSRVNGIEEEYMGSIEQSVRIILETKRGDLVQLMRLHEIVQQDSTGQKPRIKKKFPEIEQTVRAALQETIAQLKGNATRLIELHGIVPKEFIRYGSNGEHNIFEAALCDDVELTATSLEEFCGGNLSKLAEIDVKARKAGLSGEIEMAVSVMLGRVLRAEGMTLEKAIAIFEKELPECYKYRDYIAEAFVAEVRRRLSPLVEECENNLKKLCELREKIPTRLSDAADVVVSAARSIVEARLSAGNVTLDALIGLRHELSVHVHFYIEMKEILNDAATKLIGEFLDQHGGNINSLVELHKMVSILFQDQFESELEKRFDQLMKDCGDDFGKLVRLHGLIAPRMQERMQDAVIVRIQ